MKKFDAVIIGTGQCGKPLALALAGEGWKVAIAEERYTGGICINYGCTPTKTMIASAKAIYNARNSGELGVKQNGIRVDFKKIMSRKDRIVKNFRTSGENSLMKNKNITFYKATASFINKNTILLSNGSNKQTIQSNTIIVDTGAKPVIPGIEGLKDIDYLTSETILHLKNLPEHLLIAGGGYIALEFAQMFRRFGSKVTVIERNNEFLPKEDRDIAGELKKILKEEGINILTGTDVLTIKKNKNITVKLRTGKQSKTVSGSHLIVAVGIKPNTKKLNLFSAGINTDERGFIKVNSHLETNVKGIYAAGDVKGGPAFTHISYDDHRIIFAKLTGKKAHSANGRTLSYVLFTDPELARCGLNEAEAQKQKIKYIKASIPMTYAARAVETNETKGMMKALIDPNNGKILGCSILSINGGEIMSIISTAMSARMHYTEIKDMIFAHPTLAESLNTLFMQVKN